MHDPFDIMLNGLIAPFEVAAFFEQAFVAVDGAGRGYGICTNGVSEMALIRYAAAACQTDMPNPLSRRDMRANTDRMLSMIESAVAGSAPFLPVRLVVFPEFAHAAPVFAITFIPSRISAPASSLTVRSMTRSS